MLNPRRSLFAMSALGLALALVGGALPQTAEAALITAFSIDPTSTEVYCQFSTSQSIDAWKMIVREPGGGPVVGVDSAHLHYGMGGSGVVSDLTPATNYRLILKIRVAHGGAWVQVRNIGFSTD